MRAVGSALTAYARLSSLGLRPRPEPAVVRDAVPVVVRTILDEADGVRSFRLAHESDRALPPWQPGAHLDLVLPSGRLRQYSLTGAPEDLSSYLIAVREITDGGGGSTELHATEVGARLTVRGPRNAFPLLSVERYLFVAGGIGITPILPMLRAVIARGADWQFVYTGRTRASMPFLAEVGEIASRYPGRVHLRPDDEYGATTGADLAEFAPPGAALYCCGPPAMVSALRTAAAGRVRTLHSERFSPAPVRAGAPFSIELASTGVLIPVAADQSALEAVRRIFPDVAYSCQQGFCGTCPVTVLAGEVDHRDHCLTDTERRTRMALCVSRGRGRVTVELP